jgi:hypothetical protein
MHRRAKRLVGLQPYNYGWNPPACHSERSEESASSFALQKRADPSLSARLDIGGHFPSSSAKGVALRPLGGFGRRDAAESSWTNVAWKAMNGELRFNSWSPGRANRDGDVCGAAAKRDRAGKLSESNLAAGLDT